MKKQFSKYGPSLFVAAAVGSLSVLLLVPVNDPAGTTSSAGDTCSEWSHQTLEGTFEVRARSCDTVIADEASTKFEVEVTTEAVEDADAFEVTVSIHDKQSGIVLSLNHCGAGTENGFGPNGHVDLVWGEHRIRCPLTVPDVDTGEYGISIEVGHAGSPETGRGLDLGTGVYDA